MQETEEKRGRAEGKPTGRSFSRFVGRKEPGKTRDEEESNGADDLAVPDYVMRDFEGNWAEGTEGGEKTP